MIRTGVLGCLQQLSASGSGWRGRKAGRRLIKELDKKLKRVETEIRGALKELDGKSGEPDGSPDTHLLNPQILDRCGLADWKWQKFPAKNHK